MSGVRRIPSETTPGQQYRVDIRDGEAVCDCQGFRSVGHCKHAAQALKEEQMVTEKRIPDEGKETALIVQEDGPPMPLAVHLEERTLPTRGELEIISSIARTVIGAKGHAVPASIDTPAKAAAVMLAGWELGLKPMTALRHVFVVNGRTEPDGSAMMGLVRAGDPTAAFTFHTYTHEACDVSLHRGGHLVARCEYTIEDAKKSGQAGKGAWKDYTRDMLAWSAVKRVCRLGAADLINAITSVDVRQAGALLPEPIETVAIGDSGRTLAEERKSAEFVQKANAYYEPPSAADDDALPAEAAPDPMAETPEEMAERIADEKRLADEAHQGKMLPPDTAEAAKAKAHP